MECLNCTDALTALMDNELSPHAMQAVEEHLANCISCTEEYDSLQYAYELTDQLTVFQPGPSLWNRVRLEVEREPEKRVKYFPDLRSLFERPWITATVGVGLVALVVSFLIVGPASNPLDSEFSTFIQYREQLSVEHTSILFSGEQFDRYRNSRNPFTEPEDQATGNPFRRR